MRDRLNAAKKAKLGEDLSSAKWEPKVGIPLMGEFITRQRVHAKDNSSTFDIVTVRTDDGLWNVILSNGALDLGSKAIVKGDLLEVNFEEEPANKEGGKPFLRAKATVYYTGDRSVPF